MRFSPPLPSAFRNCNKFMNCPEFQIEFEENRLLSQAAELHHKDCPNCRRLFNEQTRVWQMIEALPQVEAPKDFNFQLKARIAQASPQHLQPRWWTSLRYVTPVFAIALVLTLIFAGQNFFVSTPEVAQTIVVNETAKPNPAENPLISQLTESNVQPETVATPEVAPKEEKKVAPPLEKEPIILVSQSNGKKQVDRPKTANEPRPEGSKVYSWEVPKVRTPRGLDNDKQPEQSTEFENTNNFTTEQVLSEIGIETASENGKRQVKTVRKNSVAENSGVKVGDTIEAIDGQKLGGEPETNKASGTKKLTVVREEKTIEIDLRPQ